MQTEAALELASAIRELSSEIRKSRSLPSFLRTSSISHGTDEHKPDEIRGFPATIEDALQAAIKERLP